MAIFNNIKNGQVTKNSGILVSQLTLHKSMSPVNYINEWFSKKCTFLNVKGRVALLQEPHLVQSTLQPTGFLKDLNVFIGATSGKIRAVIATGKEIIAFKITQFCNQDMVTIGIKTNSTVLVLASIYMPYDSIDPPP